MRILRALLVVLGLAASAPPARAADVLLLTPLELRASRPLVPAAYKHTPLPSYPAAAREQGLEGLVLLAVLVGTDGRVVDVRVATSSGSLVLDEAATNAVRRWTFVPARRGGRGIESVVEVPLKFALNGK